MLEAFEICQDSLKIVGLVFKNLEPIPENLEKAFEDVEIFAADRANELVAGGMSFRDAYKEVGENLKSLEKQDVAANIKGKTHLGAPGNLGLDLYEKRLKAL